jgi:rhamnosyl/mannosyltransferase
VKILHIGKYYAPYEGGMENFLRDLAEAQRDRGHEVTVLCHHHTFSSRTVREKWGTVTVIRAARFGEIAYAPLSPGFGVLLAELLRRNPPDRIHVHMPNLSAFWLIPSSPVPPVIIHWHSDVVSTRGFSLLRLFYPFYRICERRLLQKANRIIATSRAYLKTSEPLAGCQDKCTVVPLGRDARRMGRPADGNNPEHRLRTSSDTGNENKKSHSGNQCSSFWKQIEKAEFLVVSVGRFTIYKGFDVLVRAASLIPHVTVAIVGEGRLWGKINALCNDLHVEDSVLLPGKLSDHELHELVARCDAFVLPSIERTEAFGLVLLEAMYHGKPLVTSAVPGSGMNEVNADGETGFVVPTGDPDALAEAVRTLYADPGLKNRMGTCARDRFQQTFSIATVANEIDMVYGDR